MEFLKENRKNILTYVAIIVFVIIIAFIAFSGISTNVEYNNVDKVAFAASYDTLTSRNLYNPYNNDAGVWSGPNGATFYSDHITNSVKVVLTSASAFGGYFYFRVSFPAKGIYTISCQAISNDSLVYNLVRVCDGIGTEIIPYTQFPSNQRTSLTVDTLDWTGPNTMFIYLKPSLIDGFPSAISSTSVEYQNLMVESGSVMTEFCNWFTVSAESYNSDLDSESVYDSGFNDGYESGYRLGNYNGLGKYWDNIYTYHYLYSMAISGSSSWVSTSIDQDTVSFSITVLNYQFVNPINNCCLYTIVDVPGPGTYVFSCDPLDESTPGTGIISNYKIVIGNTLILTKDNTNWVQNGEIEFTVDESHYDSNTNKYRISFKYYVTDYSNPNNTTCKWSFNNHKIVSEEYRLLTDSSYSEGHSAGIILGNELGYHEGFTDGEESGYQEGFSDGEETGYGEGYVEGESDGYQEGFTDGEESGYQEGYSNGKIHGETSATQSWNGLLPSLFGSLASFFVILLDGITIFDTTMLTLLGTIGVFLLAYFLISKFR